MRGSTDVVLLLGRAERLLSRRLAAALDAERCSPDAWRVVALLSGGGGHCMTELSGLSLLPPSSLTRLVDQLVEEGLVHRRGDELDRRRIRVHLSPRGRRLHDRVDAGIRGSLAGLPIGAELLDRLGDLVAALDPVAPVSFCSAAKLPPERTSAVESIGFKSL